MAKEVWKSPPGYDGLYLVSSFGRVRSLPRMVRKWRGKSCVLELFEGQILTPYETKKGYLSVRLYKDGKSHDFPVHRLVLLTFVPNPENFPQVNHRDEDKKNNRLDNLEWCSAEYNMNYGHCRDTIRRPVAQYTKLMEFKKEFDSIISASRETGICATNIWSCAKRKRPSAGGFIWQYV